MKHILLTNNVDKIKTIILKLITSFITSLRKKTLSTILVLEIVFIRFIFQIKNLLGINQEIPPNKIA